MVALAAWPTPVLLGRRLCWFDGTNNRMIPVVDAKPMWTLTDRQDMNAWGYIATLPTENGAVVDLTYDPGSDADHPYPEHEQLSMWVSIPHPQDGRLIGAAVVDGVLAYDPTCLAEDCPGCDHDDGRWFEYVTSPDEVMRHLAWLGSLPIKAVR